jgi:hypothetical protein
MKNVIRFIWFSITMVNLAFLAGCTYEEVAESVVSDAGQPQDSEAAVKGWALSKTMTMGVGGTQVVVNGASLADRNTLVNTDPNATQDDGVDASQYTIQIAIVQTNDAIAANGPPNLRAYVSWLTNGSGVQRWESIGGGSSLTGSAQGVTVSIEDFSGTPNDEDLAEYTVTVAAVPGNRATSAVGPTLVPLLSEATFSGTGIPGPGTTGGIYNLPSGLAATAIVAVPMNVGVQSFRIIGGFNDGSVTPVTGLLVQQFDKSGNVLAGSLWSPSDGFVPLSNQATEVQITNEGAHEVDQVGLVWGIEG